MKIYVFAFAYVDMENYLDIKETRVFSNKAEAVCYLKKTKDDLLNDADKEFWNITQESDTYLHMIWEGNMDECVMLIEEHEI